MNDVKFNLTFLGAAKTVTGSSYLLTIYDSGKPAVKVMVDHGMFQGLDVESLNSQSYKFDPSEVDYLLLTHAHNDHSGRIPKLVNAGFKGKILSTKATAELTELILFDSAKIQLHNYQANSTSPIYSNEDVWRTIELFEIIQFNQDYELETNAGPLSIRYYRAGHILGAASIRVEYKGKSILFSGDLGRQTQELVHNFDPIAKKSNFIVMESLYGGKFHQNLDTTLSKFAAEIRKTIQRDGNVIIPSFAIQRSQELLVTINRLFLKGLIQHDVQVYLDSPMAMRATGLYTDNFIEIDQSKIKDFKNVRDSLYFPNLSVVKRYSQTKKVKKQSKSIIITGSGMCNGGKILDYLKSMLHNPQNMIAIVGFQAEGTLGRELIEGAKEVLIDGDTYQVKAEIADFKGFSAHGDQNDLLDWLATFDKDYLEKILLVHAEIEQSESFSKKLTELNYDNEIPGLFDTIIL